MRAAAYWLGVAALTAIGLAAGVGLAHLLTVTQ